MLDTAGIVIMRDLFDDDNLPKFDEEIVKDLSGKEKTEFIEYIRDDYQHCLKMKQHPKLIEYYRDVLTRLIKTYGH
jgi:hypothetical protein